MRRWDTEIPVLRREHPDLQILSCHDEYLLHTMFDVDGLLVGYGGLAPEPLIELIAAGKAQDYAAARAVHDRLLPVTKAVYHRGSHMEGTVALKIGLRTRGILPNAVVALAAGRPDVGGRGRDRRRPQERRPRLTPSRRDPPTQVETRLAQPVTSPAGPGGPAAPTSGRRPPFLPHAGVRRPAAARSGDKTMQSRRTPRPSAPRRARKQPTCQPLTPARRTAATANAQLVARLERIPVTRRLLLIRIIIGSATFFDAYTVLVIAFAMPLTGGGMEPHPRRVGLHPLRRLRRPTHRRDRLRLPRREDRPAAHPADHHRAVRLDGRRLPVRLERRLDDAVPVPAGHRHRRRGPRGLRLHQRVHRRQEARPVLPALRAHLPDRPAVRRHRRLLPRPALRLAGPVHRRPRPGRC